MRKASETARDLVASLGREANRNTAIEASGTEQAAADALLSYVAELEEIERRVSRALDLAIKESEDAGNTVPSLVHVVASDLRRTVEDPNEARPKRTARDRYCYHGCGGCAESRWVGGNYGGYVCNNPDHHKRGGNDE